MITLRFTPLHRCYTCTVHDMPFILAHPSNGPTSYNLKQYFCILMPYYCNRAQNNCLKLVDHLLEMVTLLQIVNDSPIENVQ